MSMPSADNVKAGAMLFGLAVVAYLGWKLYQGAGKAGQAIESAYLSAAETVKTDLNPASDKNLAYRGVNAVGAAATGDVDFSLGSTIYDWLHPDDGKKATEPTPPRNTGGASGSW